MWRHGKRKTEVRFHAASVFLKTMECLATFVGHAGWQTGLPPFRAIPRALRQIFVVGGAPGEEWQHQNCEQEPKSLTS
jgi:hypothetical protein